MSLRLQVRALLTRPPATCRTSDTIGAASRLMTAQRTSAVLVLDAEGQPAGIVTDSDLRQRVVAVGRAPLDSVVAIMTAPLVTISPEAFVFEALLAMTRHNIHHLPVVEGGRPIGILSGEDLVLAEAATPLQVARAIESRTSIAELAAVVPDLNRTTRHLFQQGLSGYEMGRLVSEVNDLLVRRAIALVEEELAVEGRGEPPVPYCWLVLGSEGRREQTLRTDQDNALVYADSSGGTERMAEQYFAILSERVIQALIQLGYPPCPGGSMASNPKWRRPVSDWRGYFADWARDPTPDNLVYSSIYFDFRPLHGEARLADALREEIRTQAKTWRSFPRYLAKVAVSLAPPLNVLGRFVLQKRDDRRGVNVKLGGMLPLTNGLRAFAIDLGLEETNTLERLEAARRVSDCFTHEETADVRQAYETLFRVRLRHQLAQIDAGAQPDNLVDPRRLGTADQRDLKEAFRVVRRLQGKLEDRYLTQALA